MSAALARLRSGERGWALVISLAVLTMMMGVGLSGYAYVDTQVKQSAVERVRESSFNLAEGALGAQAFALARDWPENTGGEFPRFCTSAGAVPANHPNAVRCPTAQQLAASFTGGDFATGAATAWVLSVRDNQGASALVYDPSGDDRISQDGDGDGGAAASSGDGDGRDDVFNTADDGDDTGTDAMPAWDQGGPDGAAVPDGRVWVRAQAVVRGRRRTLVALVRVDELVERFPRNAITAGAFATTNNGRDKEIVDIRAAVGSSASLAVRCTLTGSGGSQCLDYATNQVQPAERVVTGYADSGQALSDGALDRLRQRAIAAGTYHATCATVRDLNAPLLFIEQGSVNCNLTPGTSTACCNIPPAQPGLLVVASGQFRLSGNVTYHGVIYAANRTGLTGTVVTVNGTVAVKGAIAIDGNGGLLIGSSGSQQSRSDANVVYDPNAFSAVRSYPSGAVVPSTWQEIDG